MPGKLSIRGTLGFRNSAPVALGYPVMALVCLGLSLSLQGQYEPIIDDEVAEPAG